MKLMPIFGEQEYLISSMIALVTDKKQTELSNNTMYF